MAAMARANQTRLVFVMGTLMISGMVMSCIAGLGAPAPYNAQGAAEGRDASNSGVVGRNDQCRPGQQLTPEWRSDLAQRWDRVAAVQAARQSQPTMSAALACTTVNGFMQNCPAWDDRAPAWRMETCATALREDLVTARGRADAYLGGGGERDPWTWLLGVQTSDVWLTQGRPGNVLTSLARLESLRPTAAEHTALLDDARALAADARAIADATYLLDNTTSSCESLVLVEKHRLHQNRYAAAILSQAVAARRLAVLARLRKELDELQGKRHAPEALPDLEALRVDAQEARRLAAEASCHDEGIQHAAEEVAVRVEQDIAAESARQASRSRAEQASPAEVEPPASQARPRRREVERRAPEPDWEDSGGGCCKVCSKGKACGDSCISRSKVCHKGSGCACDG